MSKKNAEQSRAARAAAALEAQRRSERRRRTTIIGSVVGVLVLLVGAGAWAMSSRDATGGSASAPANTDGFAVVVGDADAPTTLTFYEDPQCPVCRDFEAQVGDDVAQAVADGTVKVEYRVVSFLDQASANQWSSRAANALMVVADSAGPEAFAELHTILYENQPEEGTAGPDDDQLVDWAVEAGASEAAVRPGIEDGEFDQYVVNATDQMSRDGVNGTPSVAVDGELVQGTPADAVDAVEAAIG